MRVNVQLQTATPQGPTRVCANQRQNLTYEIARTNGSVYTWGVRGGRLTAGQGSNRVAVNWLTPGGHAIWVTETSTTAQAVCYGASDTLRVTVFQDSTRGQLTAASIGPTTDTESTVSWTFNQPPANQPMQLRRRAVGTAPWQPVATLAATARTYRDPNVAADNFSYEYGLRFFNACGEPLETLPHRTVLLTPFPAPSDSINLAWTAYQGWPAGVTGYELWRKLDTETEFTRLRQLSGTTRQVKALEAKAGLGHHYRIRALTTGAAAWSNTVDLAFEHALTIPNIFTPNGDGRNDTFFIPELRLYPDNSLLIFNRWGRQVYEQQGYRGDWSASTVAGGTYYYLLRVPRLNASYKGWVEVMK